MRLAASMCAKWEAENELSRIHAHLEGLISERTSALAEANRLVRVGHQLRVAHLSRAMAQEMGFPPDRVEGIYLAATIHDIGKISIAAEILSRPGQLSHAEYNLIQHHAQEGCDMLKDVKFSWPIAKIVLQHHERTDGSGYPQGLPREETLMEARILGVADVVEAIASHRPYRAALGIDVALEEISRNSGVLYDPQAVDVCLKLFKENRFELLDIDRFGNAHIS